MAPTSNKGVTTSSSNHPLKHIAFYSLTVVHLGPLAQLQRDLQLLQLRHRPVHTLVEHALVHGRKELVMAKHTEKP